MEKVLLRKFSKKSTLKDIPGGYMENQLVSVLLNYDPKKLAYVYFQFEKVSFTDDVLQELGILGKYEIQKPGINHNMRNDYFMERIRSMTDDERMHHYEHKKVVQRCNRKRAVEKIIPNLSLNKLRLRNQGRF